MSEVYTDIDDIPSRFIDSSGGVTLCGSNLSPIPPYVNTDPTRDDWSYSSHNLESNVTSGRSVRSKFAIVAFPLIAHASKHLAVPETFEGARCAHVGVNFIPWCPGAITIFPVLIRNARDFFACYTYLTTYGRVLKPKLSVSTQSVLWHRRSEDSM